MATRALGAGVLVSLISGKALGTSSSSCTSVAVSGVGDFLSGTFRQEALSSLYDASYYRAGGLDFYWMFLYNGVWTIEPNVQTYPIYETQDPSVDPTDISLAWTVCDAAGCEFTPVTTDVVITCAVATTSSDAAPSTCTSVDLSGTGLSSGTYRQRALSSLYDEAYYRAGGIDYYWLYKYNDAWFVEPQLAVYPFYRTYDDAVHPVDVSLEWGECGSSGCDYLSAVSQPAFACAASTSSSAGAPTTCTSVVVSGTGLSSGTYRQVALSSLYDEGYYRAGGVDYYWMFKYNDAWYIEPQLASYPVYRTYDDAVHPVDITLEWTICDIEFCDHIPAPAPPAFLCANETTTADVTPASACTSVTVSGTGALDGDYDEVFVSSLYDESYTMPTGVDTNILYKYQNAWWIEPTDAGYPQYRTYDDATHPADVSLEWTLCDIEFCDHTPAPAPPTIVCADGSPLSTPAPNSVTSGTDDLTTDVDPPTPAPLGDHSTSTTSSDPITPTPTASDVIDESTPAPSPVDSRAIGDDSETIQPSSGDREIGDSETIQPSSGDSNEDLEAEGLPTDGDDGGEEGGLSVGAIVGIIAGALVVIAGGGFAFAFKENDIHCCQRHHVVNNLSTH